MRGAKNRNSKKYGKVSSRHFSKSDDDINHSAGGYFVDSPPQNVLRLKSAVTKYMLAQNNTMLQT